MALFGKKSLRIRINVSIVIVCISLMVLSLATLVPYETQRRENRQKDIELLINAVYQQKKEALANELFAEQVLALKKSMQDMQSVEEIRRIDLFRLDGQFFLGTEDVPVPALAEYRRRHMLSEPAFYRQRHDGMTYIVFETLIEIIGERVGYIRIWYDLSDMQRESHLAAAFLAVLLIVLMVGGGIFANRLLTHAIIRPAAKLSRAIRNLQKGALGEQVDIDSDDEIGSMASDFNAMSQRLLQQHKDLVTALSEKDTYADQLAASNRQLETLNAELEERVAGRTRELRAMYEQLEQEMAERIIANEEKHQLQDQLARSQKMEALGLLAGGVAHDLNNVLSGIVSYPDLLLLQLDQDSPLRKPIHTIQKSGLKASAIVQDLLTLARRGVVAKEAININDIVNGYLKAPEHQQVMQHHPDIEIQVDLADDLMPILGSAIHITKTIMNLVSNAAEAQPDGGRIVITTINRYQDRPQSKYERMAEGEYVLLRVSDEGSGIAQEDLERIFEPFYTKKVLGRSGTGLGMAVVWGTVQDHNGYIDVQSRPGEGSIFELFFPITRSVSEAPGEAVTIDALKGGGELILVVDDVAEQREITQAILEHLNYQTVALESGEKAIEYIRQHPVDLIVLDMIMEPGLDGLETYRRICDIRPSQKAIIASGYAENERVREALQHGAGAYLRKPFTIENLGSLIRRELHRS